MNSPSTRVRHWVSAYFALQGVAVISWWLVLLLVPSTRAYFRMGSSAEVLLAFWLPDLLLLGGGSLAGAWLCLREHSLSLLALCAVCGAVVYASLYCLAFALSTETGWLGVALMLPAMFLSVASTLAITPFTAGLLRQARASSPAWNLAKTAAQIVVFWGVLLFVVPYLIGKLEARVGVGTFRFPLQQPLAAALFILLSLLGLWSGFTMARRGGGTPLPLDSPRRLVVSGPYGYVRNPMAVAGLGQGLMVAVWMGSAFVLAYVLVGGWVWQCLVRPMEEADLLGHFGSAYADYRREVRCWFPRRKRYEATLAAPAEGV